MFPVPMKNKPTQAIFIDPLTEKIKHPNDRSESDMVMDVFWLIVSPNIIKKTMDKVIPKDTIPLISPIPKFCSQ